MTVSACFMRLLLISLKGQRKSVCLQGFSAMLGIAQVMPTYDNVGNFEITLWLINVSVIQSAENPINSSSDWICECLVIIVNGCPESHLNVFPNAHSAMQSSVNLTK